MLADNSLIHSMNLKIYLLEQCIAFITFSIRLGLKLSKSYIDFCYERKIAVAKVDH